MKKIILILAAMLTLASCTKEGDVIYQTDPADAPSTTPLVTVIYDPNAVGDGNYNDLIYQSVEQAAKEHDLRTMHLSPSSRTEGLAYLETLFEQMSAAQDTVRRLFIVIEKIGDPTFTVGPQVNLTGKLSYQMGDDRISASIEGKAGVGGEIGAVLKIFGFQIADWRTYFDIGPQWSIFKFPDDGSGSSGNYDPNNGGGGNTPYPFEAENEEKYKNYNYIPLIGSPVTWKSCGFENLFNGETWESGWEPFNDNDDKVNGVWFAEFKSKRPITPSRYYMTTSFNASSYPEENPKSWKVYAKANASDSWTIIATVTNDNRLSGDEQRFEYPLSVTGRQWQYFRLEVSENHGGSHMQFAEFEFDEK